VAAREQRPRLAGPPRAPGIGTASAWRTDRAGRLR